MQSALQALTAHIAEVTRQSRATCLPWSPFTGMGVITHFD